jgi:hypothetical protein
VKDVSTLFQYAVKVVCGTADAKVRAVAPGEYWTAINVHNPNAKPVPFKKKLAIALPREHPGPVSKWFEAKLGADEAFEIDRDDIFKELAAELKPDKFIKGFVVILSPAELDVVAVYTAGKEYVATMHMERVPPRKIVTKIDLTHR